MYFFVALEVLSVVQNTIYVQGSHVIDSDDILTDCMGVVQHHIDHTTECLDQHHSNTKVHHSRIHSP